MVFIKRHIIEMKVTGRSHVGENAKMVDIILNNLTDSYNLPVITSANVGSVK